MNKPSNRLFKLLLSTVPVEIINTIYCIRNERLPLIEIRTEIFRNYSFIYRVQLGLF